MESLPEEPEIVYDPPEYPFTTDEITVYIGGLTEEYTIAFVNDLHLVTDTEVGHGSGRGTSRSNETIQ